MQMEWFLLGGVIPLNWMSGQACVGQQDLTSLEPQHLVLLPYRFSSSFLAPQFAGSISCTLGKCTDLWLLALL